MGRRRRNFSLALLACAALLAGTTTGAQAAPKTVCTVTINSADEREMFKRHLTSDQYRFVELVQGGQPDWFTAACRRGVTCDVLVISGHFDDGTEFYTDRFEDREVLTVHEMQRASCSTSCSGVFSQLKEVYLFGCNTLKNDPRNLASGEIERSLLRSGHSSADAQRVASSLNARYGESNRERLRHIFKDVPVLYGFSSKAPLGRYAGPLLDRYFQTAPPGEVAGGRPSATLLELFGPASMVAVPGLTDAEPHAAFRGDMCGFADDRPSDAQKVAFMHEVLRRDVTDVRMFLDHVERYAGSIGVAQRTRPDVAAALTAIEADRGTRERFLEFARDADQATVQARMFGLARLLGWLTPEQEQTEVVQMLGRRMTSDRIGKHEVDLVCSTHPTPRPALAHQLQAAATARPDRVAHAATLACLGDVSAHERTVRALTSPHDDDVAVAQTYLRHRPLDGVNEVRAVVSSIARMSAAGAQVRALETLARQRLADPQSLQEIARLFPRARSLQVQRAIAGILIRSDTQMLARPELARLLRQHRLKSPDGSDVIDMLIRLLQA
jgi:hypothetical protein